MTAPGANTTASSSLLDRLHGGDGIGKGDIDTTGLQHGYGGGAALEFADFDVEAFRFKVALVVGDDRAQHFRDRQQTKPNFLLGECRSRRREQSKGREQGKGHAPTLSTSSPPSFVKHKD